MNRKTGRSRLLPVLWTLGVIAAIPLCLSDPAHAISETEKGSVIRLPQDAYRVQESFVYEVQAGDHLHWLAAKYYGDARQWAKILEANRDTVRNPNRLEVGQKLTIPSNAFAP